MFDGFYAGEQKVMDVCAVNIGVGQADHSHPGLSGVFEDEDEWHWSFMHAITSGIRVEINRRPC
jgi:hypothetical protein